jgi:hypothetical protein
MNQIGILPHFFVQLVEEKVSGNVTMVPEVRMQDFLTLISNPTHKSIQYWILKGEQSAWPFLPMLKYRLMIELALDRILLQLRAEASASALQAGIDGQHYPTGARHHRRQKSGPKRLTPHSTSPTVVRRGSGTNIGGTGQGAAAQQRMKMTSQAGQADQDYLTVDPYQNGYHPTHSRHDDQQHSNGTMDDLEDDLDAPDAGQPIPFSDPKRSKSMC